jgi:hypothetical protein
LDPDHHFGIDVDRPEIVDQHRHAQSVIAIQDAVEQGRLSGAEKSGQDGDGDNRAVRKIHVATASLKN